MIPFTFSPPFPPTFSFLLYPSCTALVLTRALFFVSTSSLPSDQNVCRPATTPVSLLPPVDQGRGYRERARVIEGKEVGPEENTGEPTDGR